MALGLALAGVMVQGERFAEVAAVCSAAPRGGPGNRNCGAVAMTMAVAPPQQRPGADSQGARARRCALLLLQSGHGSQSPTTGPVRGGRALLPGATSRQPEQNSTAGCAYTEHAPRQPEGTTARGRALLHGATSAARAQQHGGVRFCKAPR